MTTNDTSVEWIQYRVLHRILSVNYYLRKKIKIIANDRSIFCKEQIETIQHTFLIVLMFYPCGIILVCLCIGKQGKGLVLMLSMYCFEKII